MVMSRLGANFFSDVVVSVITPPTTSSPGKQQFDDKRNNDHHFSHNTKREKKPRKDTTYKTPSVVSWKRYQAKLFLLVKREKQFKQLKAIF